MCNHKLRHTNEIYIATPWMGTGAIDGSMKIGVFDREEKERAEWELKYRAGQYSSEVLHTNARIYFGFGSDDAIEQFKSTTIDEHALMEGVYF